MHVIYHTYNSYHLVIFGCHGTVPSLPNQTLKYTCIIMMPSEITNIYHMFCEYQVDRYVYIFTGKCFLNIFTDYFEFHLRIIR